MSILISACIILIIAFIYEIRLRNARKVIADLRLDNFTKANCLKAVYQLNDSLINRLNAKEQ